ncbi:MAG: GMC oxidoreductase [Burkholderiales bacterium]
MLFRSVDQLARSGFRPRVCIIGTGPAGISLALRLQQRNVPCLLVEAGGYDFSTASQDVYRGRVIGDPYPELQDTRLRQFGGSTGWWSGWVRPLDASAFEPRAYMPGSGWPIRSADLEPYSAAADEILKVKAFRPDRQMTRDIDYIQYRFSPPVRFGSEYRQTIEQSRSIGLLLNTPVLELVPGTQRIEAVKVSQGSSTSELRVDQVCVCTGGIENSRLLLWSNVRHAGGVVPHAAALGRYWMEHPVHTLADVVTADGYEMQFEKPTPDKWYFAPSEGARRGHSMGGAHLWMRAHQSNHNLAKELWHEALCVAPEWSNRQLKRLGKEYHCGGTVESEFEQFPRVENRVELDRRTDALGVPLTRLHWTKADTERNTALTSVRLLGEALIEHNIGRLRIRNYLTDGTAWPEGDQEVGCHHMGGTRMSDSSATGVVDKNCQVFGMSNLYVGGSSVFATSGHANPTYTIIKLALRLGDHLATKLGSA